MFVYLISAVIVSAALHYVNAMPNYGYCTSPIFCRGQLLDTVQMARLKVDSKTFVDMKLKTSPRQTLRLFRRWQRRYPRPLRADIQRFVADHFDAVGSELLPWTPPDWRAQPQFLRTIVSDEYRRFAVDLHARWPQFGRRLRADVRRRPKLYSMIAVPNPVIVPGGRYREYYYWDAYWIQIGLLHSEMFATVHGMIENFFSLIDRFGFVPNGGRIYYLGRSQPPLLAMMCQRYVEAMWIDNNTIDDDDNRTRFMSSAVQRMEREFAYWWTDDRVAEVQGYRLSRYADRSAGPRPESYWEDRQYGQQLRRNSNRKAERELYSEFKACAESGMDFSTRWFGSSSSHDEAIFANRTLLDVKCRYIVPVDLNALLCKNAEIISEFHRRLGNAERAAIFQVVAHELRIAIYEVFWNVTAGAWFDWDLQTERQRSDEFVITNLSPLWLGVFHRPDAEHIADKVLHYIERNGLDDYAGGVPTTLCDSGEQWDFPNAWSPLQHILIEGLLELGTTKAKQLALHWAQRWIYTNYVAYKRTHAMFEKYSAIEIGIGGGGGEYEVQLGFGWTNGVALDLLRKFGDRLSPHGLLDVVEKTVRNKYTRF